MWPWGHLAVAYLCYVALGLVLGRGGGESTRVTLLALAFGSQFPDLVDKPLAWWFGVLPSGRSLAHSLITASVLLSAVYLVSTRFDREEPAVAFAVGYVSHCFSDLGTDVVLGLLAGDANQLRWTTYLLWPVLEPPPYANDSSFLAQLAAFKLNRSVLGQFVLVAAAVGWFGYRSLSSDACRRGL